MALISSGTTIASGGALSVSAGGLSHIASFGVTNSNSVSIQDCFSSSYDNYIIIIDRKRNTNNGSEFRTRFFTSGTSQYQNTDYRYATGVSSALSNSYGDGHVMWHGEQDHGYGTMTAYINHPYNNDRRTTYSANGSYQQGSTGNNYKFNMGGYVNTSTRFTGLVMYYSTGSGIIEGNVWGVKNS